MPRWVIFGAAESSRDFKEMFSVVPTESISQESCQLRYRVSRTTEHIVELVHVLNVVGILDVELLWSLVQTNNVRLRG